ncbi:DUF5947 family protein [Kibdelosporangium lantanae]
MTGLRRFVDAPSPPPTVERCEMCGTELASEHGHVADVEHRSIMCACRPCYLLFTRDDEGKYRAVPDRYVAVPLAENEWQSLGIPVNIVFFLRGTEGLNAFYPSPAGATECLLDLDAWASVVSAHPVLATARPEVEAVLVRDGECYLVPIDSCYMLVGLVRLYWKGFDGGTEAQEHIAAFFDDLRTKAGA